MDLALFHTRKNFKTDFYSICYLDMFIKSRFR
jgi:hypothetical protein